MCELGRCPEVCNKSRTQVWLLPWLGMADLFERQLVGEKARGEMLPHDSTRRERYSPPTAAPCLYPATLDPVGCQRKNRLRPTDSMGIRERERGREGGGERERERRATRERRMGREGEAEAEGEGHRKREK
jgi:hypothetical protein